MKKEVILTRIQELYPYIKILDLSGKFITIEDKYGVCKLQIYSLLSDCKFQYTIEIIKIIENNVKYCRDLEKRFKRKILYNNRQYISTFEFPGKYECFK